MAVAKTKLTARAALPLAALLAITVSLRAAEAAAGQRVTSQDCGTVVVKFEPEGSGGAHKIRAGGIGCETARNVARSCVRGDVVEGWHAVTWIRTLMTKGDKRISFLLVGGGGCGAFRERCSDFFYRGVGFFGMEVLGVPCRGEAGGRVIAMKWYDKDACGFGETCDVAGFRCRGNPKNGRAMCIRHEDGNRVTWQMGE